MEFNHPDHPAAPSQSPNQPTTFMKESDHPATQSPNQPTTFMKETEPCSRRSVRRANLPVISVENGIPRHPDFRLEEPLNLSIYPGEQVAIVGLNASGKTRLIEILTGRYPLLGTNEVHYHFEGSAHRYASDDIRVLTFRDSYGDSDTTYYLQQRWNQHDIDESTPKVDGRYIISLSSGELRKYQLQKALASSPRLLILDSPFIGLDPEARQQLRDTLKQLIQEQGLQVILLLTRDSDIPDFINRVIRRPTPDPSRQGGASSGLSSNICAQPLTNICAQPLTSRQGGASSGLSSNICAQPLTNICAQPLTSFTGREGSNICAQPLPSLTGSEGSNGLTERQAVLSDRGITPIPRTGKVGGGSSVLRFSHITIRYGQRTILNDLSWTVHRGEHWALEGANGSGKSTLLSLVCADNPQAYACDIELFGRQRGTGESIWDIKRHIGYVSPEMHRAYMRDLPAIDIVASGLHDSVGLYVRPRPEQRETCLAWMRRFHIDHLADRTFLRMSSGEQRLCLLARAFVKFPDLLILDEPFHGLDDPNRLMATQIIEDYCAQPDVTLIIVSHYAEELPRCITHHLRLPSPPN
jgi:molybdate transport system ATP-binding protein